MNEQNNVSIKTLCNQLTSELQKNRYASGTIQLYMEHVNKLQRYMVENNLSFYSPTVADAYYKEVVEPRNYVECTKRFYRTVIRRLNDLYSGNGFIKSVPRKDLSLSETFQPIVSAYLDYCKKVGNSECTLKAKERALHFFFTNLEMLGCHKIEEISASLVVKSVLIIKNQEFYPEIRDFIRYLNASGYANMDYSTLVPKSYRGFRIPTTYTPQEITKVEQSVDTMVSPGKRDYAIILLASRLGIRAGDIAALKLSDIDFNDNRICFVQRKTGNVSDLYLILEIKSALKDYILNERPDSPSKFVFLKAIAPYGKISYSVVSFVVKKYMNCSGIDISGKKHGPHSLRSSLATSMVNDGVDYNSVRKVLGHEGANAIKHYAKIDISLLRQCALEAPPPSGAFERFLKGGGI